MILDEKIAGVMAEVETELRRAISRFDPYSSPHEAIAVIREEYLELEEEVFRNRGRALSARIEAIQTAAVSARYVLDLLHDDAA